MKRGLGKGLSAVIAAMLAIGIAVSPALAESSARTPNTAGVQRLSMPIPQTPQTAYAAEFLDKCEGQQWFMELVEGVLNISGRSIYTLRDKGDLDTVISLATATQPVAGSRLPAAVGELTELRYLYLGGAGLSGEIPEELYQCVKLENIDLSGNGLQGSLSPDIVVLTGLKALQLQGNSTTGDIPALPALESLDISGNSFSGGLDNVTACTTLKALAISGNPFNQALPTGISALTELRVFLAYGCGFTGAIAPELGTLAKLQVLDISNNGFSGGIPATFSMLSNLERLAIADSGLTGSLSTAIAMLSGSAKLESLDLSGNQLTGEISTTLTAMSALETLVLSNNRLTGQIPDIWGSMSALKTVHIDENLLVGEIPASLLSLQSLGGEVKIGDNYLSGTNAAGIARNGGNFISQPTGEYQLRIRMPDYSRIPIGTKYNAYGAFTTLRTDNGAAEQKEKLPPSGYEVVLVTNINDPDSYVRITEDSNGIYIELLKEVPYENALTFELRMLPYNGAAPYTYATFKAGTGELPQTLAPPSGGGGGGGGGGEAEAETEIVERETPQVEYISHEPYISGVAPDRVSPGGYMTREQAATMLHRIAGSPAATYDGRYPDVADGRWSAQAIAYATEKGMMEGYENGGFRPSGNITRAELAAVLVRMQGFALTEGYTGFADVADSHWAAGYIGSARENGLMQGYPDGGFRPGAYVTRAEAVTAINRMLDRQPDKGAIDLLECPFNDIEKSHWAYYDIMEATIYHSATYGSGTERWR